MRSPADRSHPLLESALAAGPSLEGSDWALDDDGLEAVLEALAGGRSRSIECGSGVSTILIARALRDRGGGSLQALEHDREWARSVRRRLAAERLEGFARVIDAPLIEDPLHGGVPWYEPAAVAELEGGADLLLVDGPPGGGEAGAEEARRPALAALATKLAPGCLVALDDANRPGEQRVLADWEARFGIEFARRGARLAVGAL